jgi:HSP20 family protein
MIPGSFLNPPTGVLPFDMFRSFAPVFDEGPFATWTPPCDIYESDSEIILKMELPEVKEENVQLALERNVLKLHGERKREETVKYRRSERKYGEFMRSFSVPAIIEGSKILAEFKDGTLTVTLAKERRSVKRTKQ